MKTKLLKKLRKRARQVVRVRKISRRYEVVDVLNDYTHCTFTNLQNAIDSLVSYRRYFIKGEILRLRVKQKAKYLPY